MKKIFQFVKGTIKLVLGNLDYLAAFTLGALAQVHYPELLADIANYIINFDIAAAWEAIKSAGIAVYDFGLDIYDKIVLAFA